MAENASYMRGIYCEEFADGYGELFAKMINDIPLTDAEKVAMNRYTEA